MFINIYWTFQWVFWYSIIVFNTLNECLIIMFIFVFFPFVWFWIKLVWKTVSIVFGIKPLHFLFLLFMEFQLTWVLIRCIKCLWIGPLRFLVVQGLGALHLGNLYLGLWPLLQLLLVVTIPVFFYVFTDGLVWSPSTFFCHRNGGCLFFRFGFYLYGGFWTSGNGCVHVIVIIIIRRDQPVFSYLKEVSQHFSLLQAMGYLCRLGHLLKVGVCFLEFLLAKVFDFPSCLGLWKLLWVVAWLPHQN